MDQANSKYEHVFAIVRVDTFQDPDISPEEAITVQKIVRDRATAEREVERLNGLNAAKGSVYFWQITRLEKASPTEALGDQDFPASNKAHDYAV